MNRRDKGRRIFPRFPVDEDVDREISGHLEMCAEQLVEARGDTGYDTVESAVECMKHGALDYIQKPFIEDELRLFVKQALIKGRDRIEKQLIDTEAYDKIYEPLKAASDELKHLTSLADRFSSLAKLPDAAKRWLALKPATQNMDAAEQCALFIQIIGGWVFWMSKQGTPALPPELDA